MRTIIRPGSFAPMAGMKGRLAAVCLLAGLSCSAFGAPLFPDGGFETQDALPVRTSEGSHIKIQTGDAHRGNRFLHAEPRAGRTAISNPIPIEPGTNYRIEGWIRNPDGRARLAFDLIAADGTVITTIRSPEIAGAKEWRYCAAEMELGGFGATDTHSVAARLCVESEGGADFDDIFFAPVSPDFFLNTGMELPFDKKGRIPFWDPLPGGWPGTQWKTESCGGKHILNSEDKHTGEKSIKLVPEKEFIAYYSLSYPVLLWSDRWQGRAWVRADAGARGRLLVLWTDDDPTKIIRVDESADFTFSDWTEAFTDPLTVPEGARMVRLILLAAGGPVSFDDARLTIVPPAKPAIRVLVNQVGYELGGPKSAVIAANTFDGAPMRMEILDKENRKLSEFTIHCSGRIRGQADADWGWYFWRADFSSFDKEGEFRLRAGTAHSEGESFPFFIGRDLLFSRCAPMNVSFFNGQRCGVEVPGIHAACHLDDAKMPDGTHRDLTGGWHSAGDYNKLPWEYGDGAAAFALANAALSAPKLFAPMDRDANGTPDVVDEALWGANFLSKIQIPETGNLLGDIWQGPDKHAFFQWLAPEKHTDNQIGTADDPVVVAPEGNTPLAMGAWAAAAGLAPTEEARRGYLDRARRMLDYYRGKPGSESNPHVILAAISLHQTDPDSGAGDFARKGTEALLRASDPAGPVKGGYSDSGDVPCAALAAFALVYPDDPLAGQIKTRLQQQVEFMIADLDNPFGIGRQKPGPDGYFFEPTSILGQNFFFGAHSWGALAIYRVTGDRRAWTFAADHLDWVLGKNPENLCMMEGIGSFNPPRYHHRYDAIPSNPRGAVPGAIPNGFVRDIASYDRPGFDLSRAGRDHPSYRTSEPWLVHNILNLLAIGQLHELNAEAGATPPGGGGGAGDNGLGPVRTNTD